jgi:hypothetical protein
MFQGRFAFQVYVPNTESWWQVTTETTPETNTWYHLSGTYDGSQLKIYLNGSLEGITQVAGAMGVSASDLNIGRDPSNAEGSYWNGLIDEVEIFNRALSPSEIQAIYNAGGAGKVKP